MMEIIFLGTSGSIPTKDRSLPSIAVRYEGDLLLFDCGEGTQRQMMIHGLSYGRITGIFLTHLHLDHVLGVFGLLETLRLNGRTNPLHLFGPGVDKLFTGLFNKHRYPFLRLHNVNRTGVVYKTDKYHVKAFRVYHTESSFGYLLTERDTFKFDVNKARSLGIRGKMFGTLEKRGWIKTESGVVRLRDITLKVKGRSIAYSGDTLPSPRIINHVKDVDVLIFDSTYLHEDIILANKNKHTTAYQAAQLAREARVGQLVLTHFSQRYKSVDPLLLEAKQVFDNTIAAWDGLRIKIPKHMPG